MVWPTGQIDETDVDEDGDSTTAAREDLLAVIQRINAIAQEAVALLDEGNTFTTQQKIQSIIPQLSLVATSSSGATLGFRGDSISPLIATALIAMPNSSNLSFRAAFTNAINIAMITGGGSVTLNGQPLLLQADNSTTPNKSEWPTLEVDDSAVPDNQVIKVNPGRILDSTGTRVIDLDAVKYKDLSVTFAEGGIIDADVGGNAPGQDTWGVGVNANRVDLKIIAIAKEDGTADVCTFYDDVPFDATNLPTDFVYWRRIHTLRLDESAAGIDINNGIIRPFHQLGDDIILDTPFLETDNIQVGESSSGVTGLDSQVEGMLAVPRSLGPYIGLFDYYIDQNTGADNTRRCHVDIQW